MLIDLRSSKATLVVPGPWSAWRDLCLEFNNAKNTAEDPKFDAKFNAKFDVKFDNLTIKPPTQDPRSLGSGN